MNFTSSYVKTIKQVEALLVEKLNIDLGNCFHITMFLHKNNCKKVIGENPTLLRAYESLYLQYFYLEWTNNYLSPESMAIDYDMTEDQVCDLINSGKSVHNKILAAL